MWLLFAMLLVLAPVGQNPPQAPKDRSAEVMGFDQETTVHHFLLYPDGGAIEIQVKDPADTTDQDAIRSHLSHIAMMFASGNFDVPMLVHDTKDIPGTALLSARKDSIRYRYRKNTNGGLVDITTTDPQTLKALYAFLRYQIQEHHTGDTGMVEQRRHP